MGTFSGTVESEIEPLNNKFISRYKINTGSEIEVLSLTCKGYNNFLHKFEEQVVLAIIRKSELKLLVLATTIYFLVSRL